MERFYTKGNHIRKEYRVYLNLASPEGDCLVEIHGMAFTTRSEKIALTLALLLLQILNLKVQL